MKWILRGVALLILFIAGSAWWFLLSGSDAARTAPKLFPVDAWRTELSSDDVTQRPTEIRLIEVGSDIAPGFAAQAGMFGVDWNTTYGGFQIVTPSGSIFVDGGIDAETAEFMAQSDKTSKFDAAEYDSLIGGMEKAQHILLTHEHLDHVMAVARHPNPAGIASSLRLNAPQKSVLGGFSKTGSLPEDLDAVPPFFDDAPKQLAPGVLVVPSPGHTKGSQVVFVTLQDGREYLLIGDIVWAMSNVTDLKIRPRLTQVLVFDPNENRSAIKQQVRALHELSQNEPGLTLLPAHDRDYLLDLVSAGSIGIGIWN